MNIAINTLPLSTEHRMRGTGVYTKNLIDALKAYEKTHRFTFFTSWDSLPKDTDVVHYPFFDPFFLTLPFHKPYPTVVTVHDLIPLIFPDKFPAGIRGGFKWQVQRLSLRGARAIITDSECSRRDIVRLSGKHKESVHVVPLAPSPKYRHVISDADINASLRRYNIPQQYVLYVGDVNWNKNVPGLLAAWKTFRATNKTHHLILLGSAFIDTEIRETRDILHAIESLGIAKSVIRPGFIRDEDMAAVYSGADGVVLPSWYEGFGFPVLEAFACGTPVAATNKGSVPEISGPAKTFDPGRPNEMAHAIAEIIHLTPEARAALIKKGLEWVKAYTWRRVARETVAVYDQVRNG